MSPLEPAREEHHLKQELDAQLGRDPEIFRLLRLAVLDGLWYWNVEQPEDVWISPEFWWLFGYDPDAMPHEASAWKALIFPEDLEVLMDTLETHCADPGHPFDQLLRGHHARGSTVWLRCRGTAIRDRDGRPRHMLAAHSDLTALMRSEEHLRRKERAQQATIQRQQDFAHAISHDLLSPVGTISLALSKLEDMMSAGEGSMASRATSIIADATGHIQAIVQSLREYTRAQHAEPDWRPVELAMLARQIVTELCGHHEASDVSIDYGDLPRLISDKQLLRILLQNLIDNALKFRRSERALRIAIDCQDLKDAWRISVTDNGIGIEPIMLREVFRPMRRLPGTGVSGSGMGLATCACVARALGGRIWASSAPGGGSVFWIELPKGAPGEIEDLA